MKVNYYILFSLLLLSTFLQAQPETVKGCRHAHSSLHMAPPSEEMLAFIQASAERSDTIDILDYNISLEVLDFSGKHINGNCIVSFATKMDNIDYLNLDLQTLTVDSILMDGQPLIYTHDGLTLRVNLATIMNTGDEAAIQVYYQGTPDTDPSGFGGFDFSNGYAYNLGIGIVSNPPNFGRSWYPCFDSFVERATYEFNITSRNPNKAYCVGSFIEEVALEGDLNRRTYQMAQQIPTYLSSVAISNYVEANGMHEGLGGMLPTQLVAQPDDINAMENTFVDLGKAIDALEFWYGPYAWERVGYVATPVGAMEHPTNIAYPIATATGGNSFGHRRLMAHELAHCWWGDIVTVGSARDMWVKEGNAEYGAHLMTEFAFGHEAFIDQVKDNHLEEVLRAAHVDDGGFLPLSQIPFEEIYGTHTYHKGASMLHNMRGYLGDSLFIVGQRAVLEAYRYSKASAEQYRDKLTEATGYDMTSYFNDWIKNPGYSAFEIEHSYTDNGGTYDIDLTLTQKVRAAPNLHTNVPLEITFIDEQGNKDMQRLMASGAATNFTINSSVEPVWVTVNENHTLNMAHMTQQLVLDEVDNMNLSDVEFEISIQELPQPTFLHVDHYWVAADPIENNPENAQISDTHYWRVQGDLYNGIKLRGTFEYSAFLDSTLTHMGEADMILVYRNGKNADWGEYPYYNKLSFNNGTGFMRLQEVLPGEYAFANGVLPMYTDVKEIESTENPIEIFPNPASTQVQIQQDYKHPIQHVNLELISVEGKLVGSETIHTHGLVLRHTLSVKALNAGTYWIKLTDENGILLGGELFNVLK